MNRLRSFWVQVALFGVGVAIGLGYVHVSRHAAAAQVETPQVATTGGPRFVAVSHAVVETRKAAASGTDEAVVPEGIEGPASMAFAKAAKEPGVPQNSGN